MFNLKTEFCEYLNINVFKHEESVKAGADSTHTQGACGGDPMDSPTVSVLHSPTIDVKYVFCLFKHCHYFKIILINVYHISN